MPDPHAGESLSAFTSRFMGSGEAKKSFPKAKQRYAVMRSMFKKAKRGK